MEGTWLFLFFEACALVIFAICYTTDRHKRSFRWPLMLFPAFCVCLLILFVVREKDGDGKFALARNLQEGSTWEVLFLTKSSDGKAHGIVRNLSTGKPKAVEFAPGEEPPKKFEVGKMYGFPMFRRRDFAPLEKEEKQP